MFKLKNIDGEAYDVGVGTTLHARVDTNYKIMSDIYGTCTRVTYWCNVRQAPHTEIVEPYDGLYYTIPASVTIDATDEIRSKYRRWLIDKEFNSLVAAAVDVSKEIKKGDMVRAFQGRKVPVGTVGKLIAMMEHPQWGMKVCLALDDEMHEIEKNGRKFMNHKNVVWTYLKNIEKVNKVVEINDAEFYERATEKVDNLLARQAKDIAA